MADSEALAADPDLQRDGYTTTIDSGHGPVMYWVCHECFEDLAASFSWTVK
jgi:hypothetical protein